MISAERATLIVADALGVQAAITLEDGIDTLPAWDSLGHLRIVLAIEAELGRALVPEEIAGLVGVASVAALLEAARPPVDGP